MNERHFKETLRTAMFTALAVVVCACSQDEVANDGNTLPNGKYPLQIARATVGDAQTRVSETSDGTGSQWDGGEQISVRIGTEGSVGKYTLNADGTVKNADVPCYWQSTAAQTVTAWYPAEDGTVSLADQSEGLAYVLKAETADAAFNSEVSLAFTHQMAKLTCKLVNGGIPADALSNATVKVYGYTSVDVSEGSISTENSTADWINTYKPDGTTATALLAPQAITAGQEFIAVSIDDNTTFYYKPEADITLAAGTNYVYTITVTADGITVTAESEEWTEDKSVDIPSYDPALYDGAVYLSSLGDSYTVSENQRLLVVGDDNTYSTKITVEDGATVTLKNVILSVSGGAAITTAGNVTLIIIGENKVTSTATGIYVSSGELTIDAASDEEKITVSSGNGAPGIGAYSWTNNKNSNITINGGNITAYGGLYGAGIGGGQASIFGDITINGGVITAVGFTNGAGIGAGYCGTVGNIIIKGGTVNANGGGGGAGIGGANGGSVSDITISGGTVTANGGNYIAGAGIGGSANNITISGGTVAAKGGINGAGIGSGDSSTSCNDILITGESTVVTATAGDDASDIGAGYNGICNTVEITGGATVNGTVYE